jgi:hypothetical protein
MEYDGEQARVLATVMCQINERLTTTTVKQGHQFFVTYSLKKGIDKFGDAGKDAALKEMKQLHNRECFKPIDFNTMNEIEQKRALESLIFITQKKNGTVKARHCANGNPQRNWIDREDASSPTVSTEATLLTAVIEAQEGRDVATCDIPNAFIQTDLEEHDEQGNRTIMKIRGQLVDILCELDPSYVDYVVHERKSKVLYMHVIKAIYGLLKSAMLFYKKLTADLKGFGFELNPYDPCVANKLVDGKQLTVSWHVDDLKVSHHQTKVVDDFINWVKKTYGSIGEVKTTRGKVHEYLGMKLDYTEKGKVIVDMIDYVESMIQNFPFQLPKGKVTSPWNDNLFNIEENSERLDQEHAEQFHTTTAQGLFVCKRGRPDISPAIAYLTTRVKNPNQHDWKKLIRMMKFLSQTKSDRLTLEAGADGNLHWHVDASFAVHPKMRSHTGITLTMGKGAITSISRKQGMNTRSSTGAEVVTNDEAMGPMLWTANFLRAQGYPVHKNILYQDNQSAIRLGKNGWESAGKRSRHLDIRYFFVSDLYQKKIIDIQYCPTDKMISDYMTKPTHGEKFIKFRKAIMNLP